MGTKRNRTAINGNRTAINGNRTAINGNRTANQKLKNLQDDYNRQAELRKAIIRDEPNRFKRFWKWLWYLISFPWVWCWYNFRDWRTFVTFIIVMAVVSCEVWIPYIIYFITGSMWWLGIGSACWIFWLGPGTPFIPLCITITIGIKSVINSLHNRRHNKK